MKTFICGTACIQKPWFRDACFWQKLPVGVQPALAGRALLACTLGIWLSACRHAPTNTETVRNWRTVVSPQDVAETDVAAAIAYATYLATEPADFAKAEEALLAALARHPDSSALLTALRGCWDAQRLPSVERQNRVNTQLAAIADRHPQAIPLNILAARSERLAGDPDAARQRLEASAKASSWHNPFLVREWLACLDPIRDGNLGRRRIARLAEAPGIRGNWLFERFAADFLHDLARLETDLYDRRNLQAQAWIHTLRALEDVDRQATADTALPLAIRLVSVGQTDKARDLLDRVSVLKRASRRSEELRATLYEEAANWDYAHQIWQGLIRRRDTIPQYHLGAARCLDMLGRDDEATTHLETAARLVIDPRLATRIGLTVAQRLLADDNAAGALRVLEGLPATPAIRAAKAQTLVHHSRLDDARRELNFILQNHRSNPQAPPLPTEFYHLLGNLCLRTGNFLDARSLLRQAAAREPDNAAIQADLKAAEQAARPDSQHPTL